MPTPRLALAAVAATSALLLLAGCTGSQTDDTDDTEALQERLSAARATLDEAPTVLVDLSTEQVPDGVSGLLSANGRGTHEPAFEGDVKVSTGGATLSAEVVAIGDQVWAKTSFAPTFLTIDPATLKAPNPAALLQVEGGITEILEQTTGLTQGDRSRDGETVLTAIEGTLPGDVVATILPSAPAEATFDVVYRLTDDDELVDATMTGPFYGDGTDVTYAVELTTSDEPVEITEP